MFTLVLLYGLLVSGTTTETAHHGAVEGKACEQKRRFEYQKRRTDSLEAINQRMGSSSNGFHVSHPLDSVAQK